MMAEFSIHRLRFNQDAGCFICCLKNGGFKIFNVDPLALKLNIRRDVGKLEGAEMLHRTNIVALAGCTAQTGSNAAAQSVAVWDETRKTGHKLVLEITFVQPVMGVRLQLDRLIVTLRNQVHVFSFPKMERLNCFDTRDNPYGLCEVSPYARTLIFPGIKCGSVQIVDLDATQPNETVSPVTINAHNNDLACLAVDSRGSLIATASKKGTLIRIFDVIIKRKLVELRRGSDTAHLYCMSFSPDSSFLCASSDKGTVHIFALKDTSLNKHSSLKKLSFLTPVGSYVDSHWGLANFSVPFQCPSICAFGPGNTVIAVCADGSYHQYIFGHDGICSRQSFDMFLEQSEDMGDDYD